MSILKLHTRNTSVIIKTVKDLAKKQEKDWTSLKSEKKKIILKESKLCKFLLKTALAENFYYNYYRVYTN